MYVQLKTPRHRPGGRLDWVGQVLQDMADRLLPGQTLRRAKGASANFYDLDTQPEFGVSGPMRDRTDARYGSGWPRG